MEYKRFDNQIVLRLDLDDEIIESIKLLCKKENIKLASVSGIGAAKQTEIGIFNPDTKQYFSKNVTEFCEISNLCGNITQMNENLVYAGHLSKCIIGATSEIIISVIDGSVDRKLDENIGLNLLSF